MADLDLVYLFGFSFRYGRELDRLLPILKLQLNKNLKLGLVLIHDGVIGISTRGRVPKQMEELLSLDLSMFAIKSDLIARGITEENIHNKVKLIEYGDLVDVIDTTPKVISWM